MPYEEAAAPASAQQRVLIAPDKFKGCLTALEVADALGDGLLAAGVPATRLPLADGGDGSVAAAITSGYRRHVVRVTDALGGSHDADIAYDGHTAIVEIATTCGLATMGSRPLAPMTASSRGLGEAVCAALRLRPSPRRIVIAPGGSASTDGGAGFLDALGWSLTDHRGEPIPPGGAQLPYATALLPHHPVLPADVDLVLATDVIDPLHGPRGAAHIYGPQKGATASQVAHLDAGLRAFSEAARASFGEAVTVAGAAGAGSGGGVGFAALLLGARVVSGGEFFLDLTGFDAVARHADLIVTGEGSLDHQTLRGKLLAAVARRSGDAAVVAAVGRCLLPRAEWPALQLQSVYAVADRHAGDTASDPALTSDILRDIGASIGAQLAGSGRQAATMD